MELITRAPWREAVTYRHTCTHEYVLIKKDRQQALLSAIRGRMANGEGVEGHFFSKKFTYLFIGDYKYWTYTPCAEIELDTTEEDFVLNRAMLFRDHRDFDVRPGDTGRRIQ